MSFSTKLILFSLLLLGSWSALAQTPASECTPVDMRKPGGSMENIHVRDQGETQTCVFISNSVLAETYLKRKGTPTTIDPFVLAMQASAHTEGSARHKAEDFFRQPTYASRGFTEMEIYGACTLPFINKANGGDYKRWLIQLDALKKIYAQYQSEWQEMLPGQQDLKRWQFWKTDPQESDAHRKLKIIQCIAHQSAWMVDPNWLRRLDEVDLADVKSALRNSRGPNSFLFEVLFPECSESKNKIKPGLPEASSLWTKIDGNKKIFDQLNAEINKPKPIPVQVNYCHNILTEGRSFIQSGASFKDSDILIGRCSAHASVIIGRRQSPMGCQYLIHNSAGSSCDPYVRSPEIECKDGQIWITESLLGPAMTGITYLP